MRGHNTTLINISACGKHIFDLRISDYSPSDRHQSHGSSTQLAEGFESTGSNGEDSE